MSSMKLVSLNTHRERRERMAQQKVKAWLLHWARQAPDNIDGFGLVMFRHDPGGLHSTRTHFFVRDTMDKARLPEMARKQLAYWTSRPAGSGPVDDA